MGSSPQSMRFMRSQYSLHAYYLPLNYRLSMTILRGQIN
uniref:Uncharacterized protein n=1 Tax=Anguilla anguilla TaxID=7936 RepID=A0A0E9QR43_ANGAN